uniref:Mitochondrial carrier 1 n=1 Tax=Hucho hucho TaxID=62062 RepID=A0A4W5JTF1_9TELE
MINTWLKLFIFVSSGIDSGRGLFSCIAKIFKEEGVGGFFAGVVPHVLGEVIFLWCCNLLAHFINTYAVDNNFSQAPAVRSYTKFVMGIAVSVLTYPFMLVADLMAVNNCGLVAGVPPNSPIFKSWVRCWAHLSHEVQSTYVEQMEPTHTGCICVCEYIFVFSVSACLKPVFLCLTHQGHLFRGSSFFFRRVPVKAMVLTEE